MDRPAPKHPRRRKLVYREVQFRGVAIGLCVASLVILISFQLTFFSIWGASSKATPGPVAMLPIDDIYWLLFTRFGIGFLLSVPIAVLVGISFSFKFAGPLYRFRKYFMELKDGPWDQDCRLREKDDLKELCAAINSGLDGFRDLLRQHHGVLADARERMVPADGCTDPATCADLSRMTERIDAVLAAYAVRFPPLAEPAKEEAAQTEPEPETASQLQA
jgi:hypothetical protein